MPDIHRTCQDRVDLAVKWSADFRSNAFAWLALLGLEKQVRQDEPDERDREISARASLIGYCLVLAMRLARAFDTTVEQVFALDETVERR